MFAAAPELKNITSDPKIVGKCARNSKQMTTPEQRRTLFVNCLASATGKPGDAIKQALGEVDPGNAAEKGEKAREDEQQKQEQIAQEQAAAANGEGKPKEECGGHVEGIGYFLCPILERLVDFADGTWGLFEFLLQTNPLPSDSSEPLPSAWSGLRDVANAILAIVFLAIIISQVSNIGIQLWHKKDATTINNRCRCHKYIIFSNADYYRHSKYSRLNSVRFYIRPSAKSAV